MDGRDNYRDNYIQRLMDPAEHDDHTSSRQSPDLHQAGNHWMNTGGLGISLPQMPSSYDSYSLPSNHASSQNQSSLGADQGPARLSLAPRMSYNGFEQPSRTLNNSGNYFTYAGPPNHSGPIYHSAPRLQIQPHTDSIDNLASNMLMPSWNQRPDLSSYQYSEPRRMPESNNYGYSQRMSTNRLGQLQPQRQQVTPPFNMNGPQPSRSSSPMSGSTSSPTARVSLRRATNQATVITDYPGQQQSRVAYSMPAVPPLPSPSITSQRQSPQYSAALGVQAIRSMPEVPPVLSFPWTSQSQGAQHPDEQESREPYFMPEAPNSPSVPESPEKQAPPPIKHIPQALDLPHAPPMVQGIPIVSPHELPDRFRHVFPYTLFNAVQSKCFAQIYRGNDNVVISAPTGSGKTVIFELAICKLVEGHQSGEFKIVYQAPTKSLCSERLRDWEKKFSHLNLAVAELTGDTTQAEMARVRKASIIVTTPEKWDSITRKWSDHQKLLGLVKLLLIDEVHMLKNSRGAVLEAIVSRMKTRGDNIRIVAASATVPNSKDVAEWLGKDHMNQDMPAHREEFGESFRPVQLIKHVHGYDGTMNDFAFDKFLDGKLPAIIQKYSEKKPIMVFCLTRKSCETTARILAEYWTRQKVTDRAWPALTRKTTVESKEHQDLVACGVAFHHAGLEQHDRITIEKSFLKGDISVICCTSTLAVGVNLPCHLVILKGTLCFQDGKPTECSDLDIMQMLGRAGRPQFDTKAVAVIMTRSERTEHYKKLISGQEILESTLHLNLMEHLNSEISLENVRSLYEAKRWINGTFLAVRIRENPRYYKTEGITDGIDVSHRLELMCEADIKLLQEHNLVSEGERFSCTEYGKAMSRYMVQFETMKAILRLPHQAKIDQILQAIAEAGEFHDLRIKPVERPYLREFNNSPLLKFPLKENISLTWHKIYLMILVQLGGFELPLEKEFNQIKRQFITETNIIFERAQRIVRCIIDCKASDGDSVSFNHATDMARSLSARYWENSNLQLRQIPQLGPVSHRKLIANGINTIQKLMTQDSGNIERIMSKNPPFGKKMKDALLGFPRLEFISVEIMGNYAAKQGKKPKVNVKACLRYENNEIPIWNGKKPSVMFMAETSAGTLAYVWRDNIVKLQKGLDIKFAVELAGPTDFIKCKAACEDIVGTIKTFVLQHNIPASAFPPPTQLAESKVKTIVELDNFDYGDVNDDDMISAVETVEATDSQGPGGKKKKRKSSTAKATSKSSQVASSHAKDDFMDIDDMKPVGTAVKAVKGRKKGKDVVDEESMENQAIKSVQMPNGRWTCQHICANGALLASGKRCRHKCCTEGREKPWTAAKKLSQGGSGSNSKLSVQQPKASKNVQEVRLKSTPEPFDSSDISDTELVDLAQINPPTSTQVSSKEYRKLQDLHTKVQKDIPVRLSKAKPQFLDTENEDLKLPFLHNSPLPQQGSEQAETDVSPVPEEWDQAPEGSWYDNMDIFGDQIFPSHPRGGEKTAPTSFKAGSAPNLQDDMMDTGSSPLPASTPHISDDLNTGKFNDMLDQGVYGQTDSQPELPFDHAANYPTQHISKRQASPDDFEPTSKHPRLSNDETRHSPLLPDWANEFDPEIIDQFRGFVDFEEEYAG